jgi:hypothetical protein
MRVISIIKLRAIIKLWRTQADKQFSLGGFPTDYAQALVDCADELEALLRTSTTKK